jgi:hypothetical protein
MWRFGHQPIDVTVQVGGSVSGAAKAVDSIQNMWESKCLGDVDSPAPNFAPLKVFRIGSLDIVP